jgi:hypothetical protein
VDSNHRPADYKSAALPTELCGRMIDSSPKALNKGCILEGKSFSSQFHL